MGAEASLLKSACDGLKGYYHNATECERIIVRRAGWSAIAGGLAGWIPGAGGAIAWTAGMGIIISMYVSINKRLGIKLSEAFLKGFLAVLVAEAGAYIGVSIAEGVISFIPIAGQIAAGVMAVAAQFAFTYIAGYIYIQFLVKALKANVDIANLSEEEVTQFVKKTVEETDFDKLKEEAKK